MSITASVPGESNPERLRLVPLPVARFVVPPLPAERSPFVGRETERAALLGLLAQPTTRFVVVTGPGGIGKTRLALDVARAAHEDVDAEVVFVSLAAVTDPDLAIPTIARVLEIVERSDEPVGETVAQAIGDTQLLLVLDNVEQIAAAAPALNGLLDGCPGLRLLVTSRVRLGLPGEQNFPLQPLSVPAVSASAKSVELSANPSIALFVNAARLARPAFALTDAVADPVAQICRQLEGWPLALELAAARTASIPPADLVARLSPRLPLLSGGPRHHEPRSRSMRATIAWSVGLLSGEEQALFRQLGVFHDGATLDAIEAVCIVDGNVAALADALAALVDNSLIRIDDADEAAPRYRMLETIREFALELLDADPSAGAISDRHAAWYLEVAREGNLNLKGPDAPLWLARFGAERENMRAALAWLETNGRRDDLLEMASRIAEYWDYQGELAEGRRWVERALATVTDEIEPSMGLARAYTWLGWFTHRQGRSSEARAPLTSALRAWQATGDREGEAYAHSVLGSIAQIEGEVDLSRTHFETAKALFEAVQDRPGIIETELNLSDLDFHVGDVVSAQERARRGHELAVEWEIKPYQAVAGIAVAQAELVGGSIDRARDVARTSLGLADELGFKACFADALVSLAAIAAVERRDQTAAELLGAAYGQLTSTGSTRFFFQDQFDRTYASVRNRFGQDRFERAFAHGAALESDDVLRLVDRGGDPPPVTAPRPRLTPRERDVLAGLVAGQTDKQIAADLFLSPRTVNACVARILTKLEVSTRTAAATVALRESLL